MPRDLSIAIVCKDNADTIGRVLDSVAGLADEIVAVDSGSTDATLDLLDKAGARVIDSPWLGHVKTKQLALTSCATEWVLCLDSDEPVMPDLRAAIEKCVDANDPSVVGARVNRKVWYAPGERGGEHGRFLNHAWQPEYRLRLVRRTRAQWTGLDPHDQLVVETTPGTRVIDLAGTLRHDSFATFAQQLAKEVTYARLMATSLHASGVRGSRLHVLTSPPGALLKQLILKQAWRDGVPGWLAAGSTAAATLMKHLALLELTHSPPRPSGETGPSEAPDQKG
ncbi:MAG: glycosyltransferase family 2 protein [Phycisphaerales bacterium]